MANGLSMCDANLHNADTRELLLLASVGSLLYRCPVIRLMAVAEMLISSPKSPLLLYQSSCASNVPSCKLLCLARLVAAAGNMCNIVPP
jgi:hypothetical protein